MFCWAATERRRRPLDVACSERLNNLVFPIKIHPVILPGIFLLPTADPLAHLGRGAGQVQLGRRGAGRGGAQAAPSGYRAYGLKPKLSQHFYYFRISYL